MQMRKRTVRVLTGVGVLIVTLATIYAIATSVSAMKLRRAYSALEKDNRPMRAADVIPAEVPDTENAALLYESAFLLLKAQPIGEKDLLGHLGKLSMAYANGSADPNQLPELRQLMQLETVTSAIRAVQQGATRPACRFEHDYEGEATMSPYLLELRSFTGILAARAILDAEAGRTQEAWDMAGTQLQLADALRTEPSIISQMVRLAQIRAACMTIQRLCEISVPSDEQARPLQSTLEEFDDTAPLLLAVDGERLLFGEWIFSLKRDDLEEYLPRLIGESYVPEIVTKLRIWRITFKPSLLADHAAYLDLMRDYAGRISQPYDQGDADAFDKDFSEVCRRHRLTEIIIPAIGRVKEIYLRMVAETRVTRTGLALLQYRQARGAFPEKLDELGVRYTQDPFSPGVLVYRTEADGFVLYSIGQDQKDNGGRPRQRKGSAPYDLVWRFPRQPGQ
jgi:hypothetical protein